MSRSFDEVLQKQLQNPEFREYWERTAFARAIANRLIRYRTQHQLTQTALARRIGMSQPAIARLETGEHDPRPATLFRLSRELGLRFNLDIHPVGVPSVRPSQGSDKSYRGNDVVVEHLVSQDVELVVLAD